MGHRLIYELLPLARLCSKLFAFVVKHWRDYQSAWTFHQSPAETTDMAVLPGVLGCWTLRRTMKVRLGTNTLRLPGDTPIFVVSRQQFMKYPG